MWYIMDMKKKQLSIQDSKILKGKLEGKKSHEIAEEVGLKAQTVRKRLQSSTIQDAVKQELIRQGITLEAIIKPVAEALKASEPIYSKDGEYLDEKINHSVRLAASDRAAKYLGIDKAINTDSVNQLTPEQIEQLASESDEITLTRMVFSKS